MFKLIWKNLWARRRKNGWLLAELILVSIISWVVLDPVIVVTHDRNIPLGYDAERLCLISLRIAAPGTGIRCRSAGLCYVGGQLL